MVSFEGQYASEDQAGSSIQDPGMVFSGFLREYFFSTEFT
jgi:hypothetical protein